MAEQFNAEFWLGAVTAGPVVALAWIIHLERSLRDISAYLRSEHVTVRGGLAIVGAYLLAFLGFTLPMFVSCIGLLKLADHNEPYPLSPFRAALAISASGLLLALMVVGRQIVGLSIRSE